MQNIDCGKEERRDRIEEAFEMSVWERMERIKWIDRMSNDEVLIKIMKTKRY